MHTTASSTAMPSGAPLQAWCQAVTIHGHSIDYQGQVVPGIGDFKSSHISFMPRPQDSTERLLSKITDSRLYNLSRDHGTTARRIKIEYTADNTVYINGIHGYKVYLSVRNRAHGSK